MKTLKQHTELDKFSEHLDLVLKATDNLICEAFLEVRYYEENCYS